MIVLRIVPLWLFILTIRTLQCASEGIRNVRSTNYELLENDSRFISYQDLSITAKRFSDPETTSYSELLFDVARNQVIVGARDMLYRMSFDLDLLERAAWDVAPEQIAMCQAKGQSEHLCRNYLRVLQSYDENQLYACGTYAFNPKCSWRQMENLTVIGYDSGVGKCPFSPMSNITSLMSNTGKMFVGTATDFSGGDAAILRTDVQQHKTPGMNKIIRTKQYNSNWLNNPQFVGSFEAGNFVYFVFRENAVEYMNCGKAIYSRIARVCKKDAGGDHILKDNWTSFLKARLNCSLPGEYPFYFNEVQGMTYAADEDVLYATFSTPDNSIQGSAVCAFNMTSINKAFDGPFKYQDHINSAWKAHKSSHRAQFRCESATTDMRHTQLLDSTRYQLMDQAVQPLTQQPLYHSQLERFTHIALDIMHTKTEKIHVLYVATNKNFVKKLSVKHASDEEHVQSCLVEAWQVHASDEANILNMEYLKVTDSLYVGTDSALTRIPAQHCNRHVSQPSCMNAMDPYCGWNDLMDRCTPQELIPHMEKFWVQPVVLKCPVLTAPIDGAWSAWSEWNTCRQHNENDNCLCRSRTCDNPQPQNGGKPCVGITTEVRNCTQHGGWSEWSAWSACSQTCGIAVKTRRRTCGNPKPAHGGRTCVGSEHSEMYCSHLPPCPAPKPPAVDGGWGPWGDWSECSAACGGGFRIRRRECNDPFPQNGGQECPGCNTDYEMCNVQACVEVRKLSSWTPWLVQYNESLSSSEIDTHVERRFRYACKASTSDPSSLRINLAKEETRVCRADGSCQRHNENIAGVEENYEHVEWGPCSASCGGGIQYRLHDGSKHRNRHQQNRICNTHACPSPVSLNEVVFPHEWSCWSDWSPCSVSCGVGLRRRTRRCLGGDDKLCRGLSIEEETCERPPCEDFNGWSSWSAWSDCSNDGIRYRYRKCLQDKPKPNECRGQEFERIACVPGQCKGTPATTYSATMTTSISFAVLFYAASIFITYYLTRRHFKPQPVNNLKNTSNAPSYESYPITNQYSSLPTKDIFDPRPKVKRQSSFNMCSPSKYCNGGTLNRNNMNHSHTPKVLAKSFNDCETGTLKRNSNTLNNYRMNVDDEKF